MILSAQTKTKLFFKRLIVNVRVNNNNPTKVKTNKQTKTNQDNAIKTNNVQMHTDTQYS